jgi:thiamine kinase-like enzyme
VGSPSFFAAAVYTAMRENEKALQMLGKACTDHEVEMYWLKVEPLFRPLHGDPQFENLLFKIGFKQELQK